jgi:hypothetical protein
MNSLAPLTAASTGGPADTAFSTSGADKVTTAGTFDCCDATTSDARPPMLAPTRPSRAGPCDRR